MQAQSWIPVSERLPESIADVFILTKEGSGGIGMYGEMDEGDYRWERLDHAINLNITHWMPIILPGQEEPEQGEFTKGIRANLERWDLLPKEKDSRIRTIIVWLKEVCRRYDWLVKRNAELHAENKQIVNGQVAKKEAGS